MRHLLGLSFAAALIGLVHCSEAARDFDRNVSPSPSANDTGDAGGTSATGTFTDAATADATDSVCTEDIDVVLALDVSSSMGFVLDQLDAEISKVVTKTNALKSGAHFGLVFFVDNVALDTTGSESGGKVHTVAATLAPAFRNAKKTYTLPNRNPGDGPSGPETQNPICEENSLDALHDAATEFPWRANAARIVIVVTDDTFLEATDNYGDRDGDGKTDKTSYPREGNYPARFTYDDTVAKLKAEHIRVFSFTKLKPASGLFGGCGTGRRHGEDDCITFGWTKPWQGKAPIPNATGGKNFDLDGVRTGQVSLADTINEVVLESHCAGPPK